MKSAKNRTAISVLLAIALLFSSQTELSFAQTETSTTSLDSLSDPLAEDDTQYISIDFNNVDLAVFIKFISELTGTNFVVDQRVKGKVTIISPAKISLEEAFKVFESVLEIHGYTTVLAGQVTKIIPQPDARAKNIETRLADDTIPPEDRVVTQLIPLKYADVEQIRRLFTPLVSKSSVMLAYTDTNMLILTDIHSNIIRLLKILKEIDVPGIGLELSVIPLQFGDATKMVTILSTLFKTRRSPQKKGAQTQSTVFVADERTNALVVHASEVETIRIRKLIDILDKETPKGSEKIRVYYLEHATAEELAKVLQQLPSKTAEGKEKGKAAVVSEKVRITADKSTNSLIIMAEKDDYAIIEEVISQLDIPRSMVYIESLIMEVNVDKDFDLGTEWQAGRQTKIDNNKSAVVGGFGGQTDYQTITGLTSSGTGTLLPSGFSLGVFGKILEIGGVKFPGIAAVARAYRKDKDVHILSTPQILTTDNEEATITVGKNVPFQTKSAAENGTNTYSSYEYKDVGITLKITPQISKDRMVRLKLVQEVTKLTELASSSGSGDRPTTLKRSIDTTVIVMDQSTVVIGGLIDISFTETETKIPCLGDLPGLGWLFKSASDSSEKTNLFVFLTPHVVKTPEEAVDIYNRKKGNMDTVTGGNVKMYPDDID